MEGGTVSAETVTVRLAETVPALLVAVSVYVAVTLGDTETDEPVTVPTPLLIDSVGDGVPETDHDSMDDWPVVMVAGIAAKEEIAGA
jgi:hypothetical protein